jgi:Cu2+-exporting ATPase
MDLIPGDLVRVDAGQAFPADGKLLDATAQVNEALLSGESSPVVKRTHDAVTAGTVNLDQPVEFEVTAAGPETTISSLGRQLLSLQAPGTEAAGAGTGSAGLPAWLVPAFIISVLCLAVLTGIGWQMVDSARAFPAMLAVLVASCPCALSLAIPATLSAASRNLISHGILMADSDALIRLRDIDHVVFDKTGTLTSGLLKVSEVSINAQRKGLREHSVLSIAASMEAASTHPVALAIKEAASPGGLKHTALEKIEDLKIVPGQGVQGMWNGQTWRLGTADFAGVQSGNEPDSGTTEGIHDTFEDWNSDVWLADQEGWVARFRMSESLRPDALKIVDELRDRGLHLEILSGDGMSSVAEVADSLAIPDRAARQSAGDKLRHVQRLQARGRRVLVVGDGVNDAPVLAAADVSMAVRGGADLANSVADFIFVTDSLDLIRVVLDTGRSTGQFTRQNLAWALIYNIGVMPLAVLAILQPWMAALGMSLSSLLVVGNASRLSGKS